MDRRIQEVARLAGVTSRTLRHYDAIGLLAPSRTDSNGYRCYDEPALVRLQRILLLRELGLGLPEIRQVLDIDLDAVPALRRHLDLLRQERRRLDRLASTVARTITTLDEGGQLMAEQMFDGFDHTQFQDEVESRWGKEAYTTSDTWYRGLTRDERTRWTERSARLAADWAAAARNAVDPGSPAAQELARRHVAWLASIPGTPGHGTGSPAKEYVVQLGEMYVADPRFAAGYGGEVGATFVRDALAAYAEANL